MTIIIGYLSAALMEFVLHKRYLHKPTHSHLTIHHHIFRKDYEDPHYRLRDVASKPSYILACASLSFLLSLLLLPFIKNSYLIFIVAILYLVWVEWVHFLFHCPHGLKIEQLTVFQLLKEHHREHHIHYRFNYGIGSTLMDHLMRTKFK